MIPTLMSRLGRGVNKYQAKLPKELVLIRYLSTTSQGTSCWFRFIVRPAETKNWLVSNGCRRTMAAFRGDLGGAVSS